MGNSSGSEEAMSREEERDVLDDECTVKQIVDKFISEENPKRIVVMAGAGISGTCPQYHTVHCLRKREYYALKTFYSFVWHS